MGRRPAAWDGGSGKALIAEVGRAGLTGRGGAGFPTVRKLAAVAAGHAPVVVANGTEGEPASVKDRVLMARSPQLVLDGAVLAAELTGAGLVVIVVHRDVREMIDEALAERVWAGLDLVQLEVRTAADGFVAGQASAVVRWVQRGIPAPTATPPRLAPARPARRVDAGAERRDARPPGAHWPLRRRLVPFGPVRRPNPARCWSLCSARCASLACSRLRSAPRSDRCSTWPASVRAAAGAAARRVLRRLGGRGRGVRPRPLSSAGLADLVPAPRLA